MIVSIQYLRGIAALLVVFWHTGIQIDRLGGHPWSFSMIGNAGVDLFFVISGFIMWETTPERGLSPFQFMLKRITRIIPLYWFLTFLLSLTAFIAPKLVSSTTFDVPHLLASLIFVPWLNPAIGGYSPVLIPGWTLNYEMAFYVIFAVALCLPSHFRLLAVLIPLIGLSLIGWLWNPSGIAEFYTIPLILEFGAGVLVGASLSRAGRLSLPPAMSLSVMALGVCGLVATTCFPGLPRFLAFGGPATLVVAGLVAYERTSPFPNVSLFRALGDASYSIYLVQGMALAGFAKIWGAMAIPVHSLWVTVFIIASLGAAASAGYLTYLFIERPLIAIARRIVTFRLKRVAAF